METNKNNIACRKHRRNLRVIGLLLALATITTIWFFRDPVRRRIIESGTLANDAPPLENVEEVIQKASDPRAALLAAWNSGKIVHREAAIHNFSRVLPGPGPLPPQFESILLSAALDPDMDVREAALTLLHARNHPALAALAAEQLRDVDQAVRLLGLYELKFVSRDVGVPTVIPMLDDSDPQILTTTLKSLEKWSGEKFGVRLGDTVGTEDEQTGLKKYRPDSFEKAKAGAILAKVWWARHQTEFPSVLLQVPPEARSAMQPVPAVDFQFRALDGKKIRLSDLRGKVVLINFWTTWCVACQIEMPELVELQKKYADKLEIIGVSLDYVPDDDGHIGSIDAVEEQNHGAAKPKSHELSKGALKRVHDKVVRKITARGVNYPILLDEQNEVGGRYNGGELPTTVIVDSAGNIRRRFIGARSLPVFEAMLAEITSNKY